MSRELELLKKQRDELEKAIAELEKQEPKEQDPHADLMIQYHQCSDADKKRWHVRNEYREEWNDLICKPSFFEDKEYRLKPDIITINGKEYNAPLRVAPEIGSTVWLLFLDTVIEHIWEGTKMDKEFLRDNCCFSTQEDAQSVLTAIQEILRGQDGS